MKVRCEKSIGSSLIVEIPPYDAAVVGDKWSVITRRGKYYGMSVRFIGDIDGCRPFSAGEVVYCPKRISIHRSDAVLPDANLGVRS